MTRFMDVHMLPGVTKAAVEQAHAKDLAIQKKHGVKFLTYWVDEKKGNVFCLSEALDAKATQACHKEAGHPADEVYQVHEGH